MLNMINNNIRMRKISVILLFLLSIGLAKILPVPETGVDPAVVTDPVTNNVRRINPATDAVNIYL